MEWLVGIAVAVGIWWIWSRSKQNAAVSESALRNLFELDALGAVLWERLDAAIARTPNPSATCRSMLAMDRARLPDEINELWSLVDDHSKRVNERAEHYELVARRPAPSLPGRSQGDQLMLEIKAAAASKMVKKKPTSVARKSSAQNKNDEGKGSRTSHLKRAEVAELWGQLSDLMIEMTTIVAMDELARNPDVRDGDVGFKAFSALETYLGVAGAIKLGLTTRLTTDLSSGISIVARLNAAHAIVLAEEAGSEASGENFVAEASEKALEELGISPKAPSARVSEAVPLIMGVLAQHYSEEQQASSMTAAEWNRKFRRDYASRFG